MSVKGAEAVSRVWSAVSKAERTLGSQLQRDSSFSCSRDKVYKVLKVTGGTG